MMRPQKRVLDYSFCWTNRGSIWDTIPFNNIQARKLYQDFLKTRTCPYCRCKTAEVLSIYRELEDTNCESRTITVSACLACGWWSQKRVNFEPYGWSHEIRTVAYLRKFDIADSKLPLDTLTAELRRRPNIVYDIHSKKFEELVADVLSEYFEVEVTVVGRTGDGGIDLVYIDGHVPAAVQVKRREHPESVETVAPVREFVGAMLLEGFKRGTIVSTASRFSRGAKQTREKALQRGLVEEFQLVDMAGFWEMFQFREQEKYEFPWQGLVAEWVEDFKDLSHVEIQQWRP